MNTTNAMATQVSASCSMTSALDHTGDRRVHGLVVRRLANQPLDDAARGIGGDRLHVAHRRGLGAGDRLFGGGELDVEPFLERLAVGFRLLGLPVTSLAGDRLRAV